MTPVTRVLIRSEIFLHVVVRQAVLCCVQALTSQQHSVVSGARLALIELWASASKAIAMALLAYFGAIREITLFAFRHALHCVVRMIERLEMLCALRPARPTS